ncbi:lipid-A-disaccharide synthase [candidate division KSB1 bacterium]|nr:MAG: lipid-A-disaccharide synthase [candidate division KSB1 bacterium]
MKDSGKNILIIAGEPSGDLLGAPLISALKKLNENIEIYGIGGNLMINEGLKNIFHIDQLSIMGITEIIRKIPFMMKVFIRMKKEIAMRKPDIIVLIDYPGFNLRFAKIAKKKGFKVFYYVSPQIWAWRKKRIKSIAKYVDTMAVVFKFEEDIYKKEKINAEFVSHPALERIKINLSKEEFLSKYKIRHSAPVIGLLPGSRKQEVMKIFPIMIEAVDKIKKKLGNLQVVVGNHPSLEKSLYEYYIKDSTDIFLTGEDIYESIKYSDFLIISSGTATIESAILETPMLIVYRVSPITYYLGKYLVKLPYIGMVNILAGKMIVPELIQKRFNSESVAETVIDFLNNPDKINNMKEELRKVKSSLGDGSASTRTAELILKEIEKNEKLYS